MNKISAAVLLILFQQITIAQTKKQAYQDVKKIETMKQAESYCKQHPNTLAHIYTIPEKDTARYSKALNMKIGKPFTYYDNYRDLNFAAKVMLRYVETVYDVQYIFLDGTTIKKTKIDSIQKVIISEYDYGVSFDTLFQQYNMDGNPNGKLSEIRPGMLVKEFENECKNQPELQAFEIDIPDSGWFYVVIKTRNEYQVEYIKLLSVQYHTK